MARRSPPDTPRSGRQSRRAPGRRSRSGQRRRNTALIRHVGRPARRRSRSPSEVHQPQETRIRPVPGISRTWTSASIERSTMAAHRRGTERDEGRALACDRAPTELDPAGEKVPTALGDRGSVVEGPRRATLESREQARERRRRPPGGSKRAAPGFGRNCPSGVVVGLREVTRCRDAQPVRVCDYEGPRGIGPAKPLLARDREVVEPGRRTGIAPTDWAPSTGSGSRSPRGARGRAGSGRSSRSPVKARAGAYVTSRRRGSHRDRVRRRRRARPRSRARRAGRSARRWSSRSRRPGRARARRGRCCSRRSCSS